MEHLKWKLKAGPLHDMQRRVPTGMAPQAEVDPNTFKGTSVVTEINLLPMS